MPRREGLLMIELKLTDIVKKPSILREALSSDKVRIIWREPKPKGKIVFTAICEKEGVKNAKD